MAFAASGFGSAFIKVAPRNRLGGDSGWGRARSFSPVARLRLRLRLIDWLAGWLVGANCLRRPLCRGRRSRQRRNQIKLEFKWAPNGVARAGYRPLLLFVSRVSKQTIAFHLDATWPLPGSRRWRRFAFRTRVQQRWQQRQQLAGLRTKLCEAATSIIVALTGWLPAEQPEEPLARKRPVGRLLQANRAEPNRTRPVRVYKGVRLERGAKLQIDINRIKFGRPAQPICRRRQPASSIIGCRR